MAQMLQDIEQCVSLLVESTYHQPLTAVFVSPTQQRTGIIGSKQVMVLKQNNYHVK